MTLELRLAAESPAAKAKAEAAQQRMAERGREPGWSLLHNPTPFVVEQSGYRSGARAARSRARKRTACVCGGAGAGALNRSLRRTDRDLMVLRAEVDFVEAAGARSPATVYPPPAAAGRTSTNRPARRSPPSPPACKPSRCSPSAPDADKHAALAAVTAAVHGKNKHVLAMPATDTATAFADTHPYAERRTDPAATRARLDNGTWTIPAGQPAHHRRRRPPRPKPVALLHRARRPHQHQTAAGAHPDPGTRPRPHPRRRPGRQPALGSARRHPDTGPAPPDRPGPHQQPPRREPTRHHRTTATPPNNSPAATPWPPPTKPIQPRPQPHPRHTRDHGLEH